jgi:hypothetical protein
VITRALAGLLTLVAVIALALLVVIALACFGPAGTTTSACTGANASRCAPPPQSAFVTTLGSDTVAVESFTRTGRRLEGDLMVRVPGTVWFHYVAERDADGLLTRTMVEAHAPGRPALAETRVTLELRGDSARLTADSAGHRRSEMLAMPRDVEPIFMTGFDESYGLYNSIGMYEFALARHPFTHPDTLALAVVNPLTARTGKRLFARRAPTAVDADFFRIAWTHLELDPAGNVLAADATGTTEKTVSRRVAPLDVPRLVRESARRDRAGTGLGHASPDTVVSATLGGNRIVISYGSPRRRGRAILGAVVPYDQPWRTGANAATVLMTDAPILVGETVLPAGAYSLWTIPHRDGGIELVINRQHGQWGTSHDPAQDLARVAMQVESVSVPREAFAITLDGTDRGRALRIAWDTFVWSVPVTLTTPAPR